ncbi:DUF4190 domain-containing protein [Nocardia arizonensis]|uniref:DUF4190 domain-containing protein n=1 Tax=Nocardia arizonensis TaxID=1141647 RepID=UPI0027D842D5|nr:DUF4190 domain-containing protein [Nocardia arizonensis]
MSYPPPMDKFDQSGQQPYGQQPYGQPYPPQQPYGQPYGYGYAPPPDHPQATTILILGILSLVVCGVCGPFAWSMGNKALKEIDASGGAIGGRGNVKAGYICGIIGTIGLIIGVLFLVLYIVLVVVAIGASTSGY